MAAARRWFREEARAARDDSHCEGQIRIDRAHTATHRDDCARALFRPARTATARQPARTKRITALRFACQYERHIEYSDFPRFRVDRIVLFVFLVHRASRIG